MDQCTSTFCSKREGYITEGREGESERARKIEEMSKRSLLLTTVFLWVDAQMRTYLLNRNRNADPGSHGRCRDQNEMRKSSVDSMIIILLLPSSSLKAGEKQGRGGFFCGFSLQRRVHIPRPVFCFFFFFSSSRRKTMCSLYSSQKHKCVSK
jgi:hypothetical protein